MSDLGVVDPIRMPGPTAGLVERVRRWPALAQAFAAFAALDAVARTLGVIEPSVRGDAFGLLASYVPRDAWILLPTIVLVRRPSAAADTPWLFRGAVAVALVTLLARPTASILGNVLPADAIEPHVLLATLDSIVTGAAYAILGYGLVSLGPQQPRAPVAGLANLGALAVLAGYALDLVGSLWTVAGLDPAFLAPWWNDLGAIAGGLGIAYLVRATTRGLDDPARPERATRAATSGALIWALGLLVEGVGSAIGAATRVSFGPDFALAIGVLQVVGPLLVVIGFGLGLADPLRPMAKEWAAALRAEPRPDASPT